MGTFSAFCLEVSIKVAIFAAEKLLKMHMKSVDTLEETMVAELGWSDDELREYAHIAKEQYRNGQVVSASDAISHFRSL